MAVGGQVQAEPEGDVIALLGQVLGGGAGNGHIKHVPNHQVGHLGNAAHGLQDLAQIHIGHQVGHGVRLLDLLIGVSSMTRTSSGALVRSDTGVTVIWVASTPATSLPFSSRMTAATSLPFASIMGSTVGAGFCSTLSVKVTAEAGTAKVTATRSTERNTASFFMGESSFQNNSVS